MSNADLLDHVIFVGLTDLSPWFDSPAIKHFTAKHFRVVIDRCNQRNVRILGIELFTPGAELVELEIAPEHSCTNAWCLELMDRFEACPGFSYCATYDLRAGEIT